MGSYFKNQKSKETNKKVFIFIKWKPTLGCI